MRLIEVGTKLQNQNKKDEAKEIFDLAYELFNIFWGIKLNIIPTDKLGLGTDQSGSLIDQSTAKYPHKSVWLKNLIEKIIDCCKE
jgi:hypothetical protein